MRADSRNLIIILTSKFLAGDRILTDLNLDCNRFKERGGRAIGKALDVNSTLTQLNLGRTFSRGGRRAGDSRKRYVCDKYLRLNQQAVDKQGSALVIKVSDETSLSVEIQAVDRLQLVNAQQSFEDINQQALMDQESSVYANCKDMQSEVLRFRTLGSSAMIEVERSVDLINMKRKRE